MEEWTLDNVSTEDIFPDVNFQLFLQFFQKSDDSIIWLANLYRNSGNRATLTTESLKHLQIPQMETLQAQLSDKTLNGKRPIVNENNPLQTPLVQEDMSRFPVISSEEITEMNESAANRNT